MEEKINLFDLKIGSDTATLEMSLDQWDDIKFYRLWPSDVTNLLNRYANGEPISIVGTSYENITYDEMVIEPVPNAEFTSIEDIIIHVLNVYIDTVVGFDWVLDTKNKSVHNRITLEEYPGNMRDVYRLGKFCRKINISDYYRDPHLTSNFHYYIEKK